MEAIGQLTAGITHNFNNKLMVVLNSIEMAMFREYADSTALQKAETATLQAAEIVKQLMMFSRSERTIDFQVIKLQTVLNHAIDACQKIFDPHITIDSVIPENLPTIFGDANQLEQVFLNLMINARDAVEEREVSAATIRIEADAVFYQKEERMPQPDAQPGSYVRIIFSDNGVGMDEETQQSIFDPFFTTKEEGKGTGLGLSTVYGIIKEHKGWIECESQAGEGTIFAIHIHVSDQEEVASPGADDTEEISGGTETILFIEDEEIIQQQATAVMERNGYTVLVSDAGHDAWEIFQREQEKVDLVLLDMSLKPGLSGREILARMLNLDPEVKVILSTGYTQYSAESLGAKALLKKPYSLTQALQTIRDVLDG